MDKRISEILDNPDYYVGGPGKAILREVLSDLGRLAQAPVAYADPLCKGRDAATVMGRAFSLCPSDLPHLKKMQWLADYYEKNRQPEQSAPTDADLMRCWVEKPSGEIDGIASMRAVLEKFGGAHQPAQQEPTDSMGIPASCGKPLCSPGDHHPLCKLAEQPATEGYKLVPLEPTEEMLRAGCRYNTNMDDEGDWTATRQNYAGMLAAAPQPAQLWVGLTPEDKSEIEKIVGITEDDDGWMVSQMFALTESNLRIKNAAPRQPLTTQEIREW